MAGSRGARATVWLTMFATAMGLLEAAVVVYLRELFYPDGFRFPLMELPARIQAVELAREGATLVMLVAVAALARTDRTDRFFVFAYLFGVWDIVYYAGLWLFLGWPESLLTWDVLFLIPVPWVGPVLAPLIVSALLIAGFAVHERLAAAGGPLRLAISGWAIASAGALLIVVSFCWRYRSVRAGDEPQDFPWLLFASGVLVGAAPPARAAWKALAAARGARSP
jgi:hypothetical protein